MRDRIVIGIRDDATRKKLLQTRNLELRLAVDICKSSEAASRQVNDMNESVKHDAVHVVGKSNRPRHDSYRGRMHDSSSGQLSNRSKSPASRCKFCNGRHRMSKDACPAYGKTCNKCKRSNHFASVCNNESHCNALEDVSFEHDAGIPKFEPKWLKE